MKKIVTIAAVAALATLTACNKAEEAPAVEAAANEAVANEAAPAEVGKPADEIVEATAPAVEAAPAAPAAQ